MPPRRFALSAVALSALAASALAAPTYRIELVPKGNGIQPTTAGAISDNGNVVGSGRLSGSPSYVSFIAKSGKKPVALDGSTGAPGYGFDVNDAGQAVGYHLRNEGSYYSTQGAMWTADGQMHDLEELVGCDLSAPDDYSSPGKINASGDLTYRLNCTVNGTHVDGSVFVRDGVMTVLPALGGDSTYVSDINRPGQVTGGAELANGWSNAFIWENGTMKSLGTLGGSSSWGSAINDAGHVAGSSTLADLSSRTFLYDGTAMHELPLCEGKHAASPVGLTNDDLVVGVYGGRKDRRTVLIRNGHCDTLTSLLDASGANWTNLYARGVNNHGVIVGEGQYLGKARAFIAKPITAK